MASGLLGISVSGLNAAQAGIRTTQHNIANVNTAGYRRQEVNYGALTAQFTGAGYFGTGVGVDAVRSVYSQLLDNEVLQDQSQLSRYETYSALAGQVDRMLGDSGSGLSTSMDAFFAAANELANDPTSNAARQNLLSNGANLAGRVNMLNSELQTYRTASNNDVAALTEQINQLSGQVASLNASIGRAEALNGQPANDLRDQRDQFISDLNKLVNVSQVSQADGSTSLFIGSGQALVVGNNAYMMSAVNDPNDSTLKVPAIDIAGTSLILDSSLLVGGQLGGLLAFRDEVLQPAMDDLNRITISIAATVNEIHRSGLDLNLNAGGAFFTDPLAGAVGNTGNLNFSLGNDLQLVRSDYTLSYDGANYTLTRLSDGTVATGALAAVTAGQGFSLSVATPAAAGDTWTISLKDYARSMRMELTSTSQVAAAGAAADGPGDNTNALALAALQSAPVLNNGTATFAAGYSQAITRTASLASEADMNSAAFTTLVEQAVAAQGSVSGVNLDDEAVNLIRFQQAYQASAKAIQVASSLFDELIGILR